MDIRPIHNDSDHEAALQEVERLWGAAPGTPDGDRLEVLATLIDSFENETIKITASDPVELLHYAITEMGHTQSDLAELLGSRSRASEILGRKRRLAIDHVAKISAAWRLPAELLVQPYALTTHSVIRRGVKRRRPSRRSASEQAA